MNRGPKFLIAIVIVTATVFAVYTKNADPPTLVDSSGTQHLGQDPNVKSTTDIASSGDLEMPIEKPALAGMQVNSTHGLTVRKLDKTQMPPGPLVASYSDLRRSAEMGDAIAAYSLSKALGACATVPRTRSELDQNILDAQQGLKSQDGVFIRDLEASVQKMESQFEYCEGVTKSQIEETARWLVESAEGGSLEAKTYFLSTAIPLAESAAVKNLWIDDHARVSRGLMYLSEAAGNGSIDAMALYGMYLLDEQVVIANPVSAATYLLAASGAYDEIKPSLRHKELAEHALNMLSSSDAQKAEQGARALLEDPSCCLTFE